MTPEHGTLHIDGVGEGHVRARVRGEIDLANAGAMLDDIARAARGVRTLTLDLAEVTYFDSQGARVLQHFADAHAAGSVELQVVARRGSMVHDVIRLTCLDRVLPMHLVD